jgi:lysophospholipase L1-like esterase
VLSIAATACSPSHAERAAERAVAAYDACPAPPAACAVMPFGDSITYGQRSSSGGGYRDRLFQLARAQGKRLTFVGGLEHGPDSVDGVAFPRNHEGYPGFTIDGDASGNPGIARLAAAKMHAYKPNIVMLMIGTNDITLQLDPESAPQRLGALIDTILAADPRVLLIVAQIVPTRIEARNKLVQAYNAAIPELVAARAGAGKRVVRVDMFGAFTSQADYKTALLADVVHPNDRGYELMARVWYSALGPYLH